MRRRIRLIGTVSSCRAELLAAVFSNGSAARAGEGSSGLLPAGGSFGAAAAGFGAGGSGSAAGSGSPVLRSRFGFRSRLGFRLGSRTGSGCRFGGRCGCFLRLARFGTLLRLRLFQVPQHVLLQQPTTRAGRFDFTALQPMFGQQPLSSGHDDQRLGERTGRRLGRFRLWHLCGFVDQRDRFADFRGIAFLFQDLRQHPGGRRRQIHTGLVRLQLDNGLVPLDPLAFAFVPLTDLNFLDRLTRLRNFQFVDHFRVARLQ
jgi:hypothetical protein